MPSYFALYLLFMFSGPSIVSLYCCCLGVWPDAQMSPASFAINPQKKHNILIHLRLQHKKKLGCLCFSAVWFDVVGTRRLHSFRVNEKQMRRSLVYVSWQTVSLICVSVLAWEDARRRNRRDEASPWPRLARPQQIWRNSNLIVPGWTLAWYALHAAKAASSQIILSEILDFLGFLLWFFFFFFLS